MKTHIPRSVIHKHEFEILRNDRRQVCEAFVIYLCEAITTEFKEYLCNTDMPAFKFEIGTIVKCDDLEKKLGNLQIPKEFPKDILYNDKTDLNYPNYQRTADEDRFVYFVLTELSEAFGKRGWDVEVNYKNFTITLS